MFSETATHELQVARLCTELKCLPSQLRNERWQDIDAIVALLHAEAEVRAREAKKRK